MRPDPRKSLHNRWPVILAVITAVAGILISLHLRSRIAQTESTQAQLIAETLQLNTEQEMSLFVDVLESVRALHALSDAVDQAAMDEFIEKGLIHQHDVLGTFGLAQRISQHLRIEIENRAKQEPGAYALVQTGPDNRWVPAEQKNTYYPLTWQSRANGLNLPIGFDFSSQPEALRTIKRIEHTRQTTLVPKDQKSAAFANLSRHSLSATAEGSGVPREDRGQNSEAREQKSPFINHQSSVINSPAPSYWVFSPVVPRQTPGIVIGFAVAAIDIEAILQQVANRFSPKPELKLTLISPPDSIAQGDIQRQQGRWISHHPIHAIGAQWVFECSLPETITGHRSTIALAIGLIITLLVTSQILLQSSRTKRIEEKVRMRTDELHIANTQLEEHLEERVRMEEEMNELTARERRRIGRVLHDSLGQHLTGAVFISRSLLDYFLNSQKSKVTGQRSEIVNRKSSIENQTAHAKTLNETLKSAVSQVRNMARGLASVTLNDESLEESLEQLADEMGSLYDIACAVTHKGTRPNLSRKTKEQLYFIAREAVNNAARHAQPEQITILLNNDPSGWTLRIEDDGKGLTEQPQAEQTPHEGMGLRIMRHRAKLIGAQFTITSAPDKGTYVQVVGC